MPMQQGLPTIKQTIELFGLATKKSLGQHFLLDSNITEKIARAAGDLSGVNAIEIGPGPGGLTRALLATNALSVTALEKDTRCMAALAPLSEIYGTRFDVREMDALSANLPELVGAPRAIVANLPYNIGTELVIQWLHQIYANPNAYKVIVVMLQKEVAERMAAQVGSKAYGRISVLCQWLCQCRLWMELPPSAFSPPPKVTSTVIVMSPRLSGRVDVPLEVMERVTKAAFGARRKMLRQSLKSLRVDAAAWCAQAGIAETERAEQLSVEQFIALVKTL